MKQTVIAAWLMLVPLPTIAVDIVDHGDKMDRSKQTADSILNQADAIFQDRNYQAALEVYEKSLTLAREEFNRSIEVEALSQMARMNLLLGDKDAGRKHLEEASARADDAEPNGWSRFLGVRGRFEWQDDDLKSARATFEQMYEYCKANSLYSRAVDAAHMVAIVAENPADQIEWGKVGIEAAEKTDNEKWLGPLWNNMAGTYYDQKDYTKALECYLKAREYHWRFSDETGKLYADYHVGMTYRLLEQYDEAGKWLRPVLAWAERVENHSAIGQACEDLGEIEAVAGNKSAALVYLKRARDEYKKEGYDESWKEVWDNINVRINQMETK